MILKSKCSEFQSDWRLFFVHGLLTASAVVGSSGGATGIRALYLASPHFACGRLQVLRVLRLVCLVIGRLLIGIPGHVARGKERAGRGGSRSGNSRAVLTTDCGAGAAAAAAAAAGAGAGGGGAAASSGTAWRLRCVRCGATTPGQERWAGTQSSWPADDWPAN